VRTIQRAWRQAFALVQHATPARDQSAAGI
jgi:hypothetical protein